MSNNSLDLEKGTKVYFPDGDKYFFGEWTGMRASLADGSDVHYLIHCYDCGRLHPIPVDELFPLPDMGLEELPLDDYRARLQKQEDDEQMQYLSRFANLSSFKRAVNREKYQRRRAMALVITGICSAILAGFAFLDGRALLGSILTLVFVSCYGLSYLVERR